MRSIIITGGTGSFGRAYTRHLLDNTDCARIVIFSRSEHAQAQMAREFGTDRCRYFIGDVRDRVRLRRAFDGCEVVVHAAALKRIEVGEYNPQEMVKTNVLGTMNVVEAAQDAGCDRVVGISSDKAWRPVSPYGYSKALAEAILLNANNTVDKDVGPKFSVVRYGNVAGSAGSVIPKWREILARNPHAELEITDPECTRFWMLMEEAVALVHKAVMTSPRKLVVPKLPAFRVGDLAFALGGCRTRHTGLPAWEKRHEGMEDGNTSDCAKRMSMEELKLALENVARTRSTS